MPDDLELQFRILIDNFIEFWMGEDEFIGKGLIPYRMSTPWSFRREVLCKCEKRYIKHLIIDRDLKPHKIFELYRMSLETLKRIMRTRGSSNKRAWFLRAFFDPKY